MQLIDDQVGEVRSDELAVVPRISVGRTYQARADWEGLVGGQFACIWIALVTARSYSCNPVMIRIAVLGIGDKSCPIPVGILGHQQVIRLAGLPCASKAAVDIHRGCPGRPEAERGATPGNEIRAHRSR